WAPQRVSERTLPPPRDAQKLSYQWPTWSPGGTQLAYLRLHYTGGGDSGAAVVVSAPDGSAAHLVFDTQPGRIPILPFTLVWSPDGFRSAAWSPDGSTVVVSDSGPEPDSRLVAFDTRRGTSTVIAQVNDSSAFVWSPDSTRLAVGQLGPRRKRDGHYATLDVLS